MGFKNAKNFNYERSINPSQAQFFYLDSEGRERPLPLHDQSVVGAFGSYTEKDQELNARLVNPNPQRVDMALLPLEADTIRLRFGLSFVENALVPRTCNDADMRDHMIRFAEGYRQADGFRTLAERYQQRILDAGWLWRNHKLATDKRVKVATESGDVLVDLGEDKLPGTQDTNAGVVSEALVEGIRAALAGETGPFRIVVTGEGVMGPGQEVFPSQEFIDPNRRTGAGASNKSRHLAYVTSQDPVSGDTVRQAIFHPQKIGNWIRRVDDWYADEPEYGPIPAEPYGMMLERFNAARWPSSSTDLYSQLQDKVIDRLVDQVEKAGSATDVPDNAHFVMACLVRGGVFSANKEG